MSLVFLFVIIIAAAFILFSLLYLIIKPLEHRKIRRSRVAGCDNSALPEVFKIHFKNIADRTYVFYYSYCLQTIITLLCNLFSLVFSIATFLSIAVEQNDDTNYIVSMITIVIVAVTIYLRPQRRSSQYLHAYRKYNKHSQELLIAFLSLNPTDLEDVNNGYKIMNDSVEYSHSIESLLTSDDDDN
jgi:hypothetical protein